MIETLPASVIAAVRSLVLHARAAFYDVRAVWQEGKKATLPDASTGIESATRHSDVAYKADRSRRLASELRKRAGGK